MLENPTPRNGLIQQFNRTQTIKGTIQVAGGIAILVVIWIVFRTGAQVLEVFTGSPTPRKVAGFVPGVLLGVGSWRWWKSGDRFRVFRDSAFFTALRQHQGLDDSIIVTGPPEHPVDGFRDFFAHIFLGGPSLICNGTAMILSRLPVLGDLEPRMEQALQRLRLSGKWESAEYYRDLGEEIGALIRSGHVDFSPSKFILRAADGKNVPPEDFHP